MNKLIALVVGGVVVVGGGTAILLSRGDGENTVTVTNQSTGQSQSVQTGDDAFIAVDACEVLTDAAAKQVLGDSAKKGDTSAGNVSSDDVSVSNCVYNYRPVTTGPALQQLQSTESVGILARAARTKAGADSNKAVFGAQKPAGVQDVSGYGNKAYFNPATGQMNVLKGNNWYILSHYTGTSANKATLAEATELADAVKNTLK